MIGWTSGPPGLFQIAFKGPADRYLCAIMRVGDTLSVLIAYLIHRGG